MKRKSQHDAVNNQEDEDSCTRPICFPNNTPVDKKEDNSIAEMSDQLFNEASSKNDELKSNLK
jgi:hypothetical protein